MFFNAASALLRFLLTMLVLTLLVLLTLRTPLAWMSYMVLTITAILVLGLGVCLGYSVRRLR